MRLLNLVDEQWSSVNNKTRNVDLPALCIRERIARDSDERPRKHS